MKNEQSVQNGSKTKRRFRYLFRRDSKPQQQKLAAPKDEGNDGMPYEYPAVESMTPAEVDKEIKLRVESLQRRGILPRVESETKDNVVTPPAATGASVSKLTPPVKPPKDRPAFKPKFFIKRRASGA